MGRGTYRVAPDGITVFLPEDAIRRRRKTPPKKKRSNANSVAKTCLMNPPMVTSLASTVRGPASVAVRRRASAYLTAPSVGAPRGARPLTRTGPDPEGPGPALLPYDDPPGATGPGRSRGAAGSRRPGGP